MSKSYCNLLYHLVFSTKRRERWLKEDMRDRIYGYLGGTIRGMGGIPLLIGGVEDHVHILAKLDQNRKIKDILSSIKSCSSGWIHEMWPDLAKFEWQVGYGAFTISPSQLEKARRYVANQQNHHKKVSFQEEFVALLIAHGIEHEEKYLWD